MTFKEKICVVCWLNPYPTLFYLIFCFWSCDPPQTAAKLLQQLSCLKDRQKSVPTSLRLFWQFPLQRCRHTLPSVPSFVVIPFTSLYLRAVQAEQWVHWKKEVQSLTIDESSHRHDTETEWQNMKAQVQLYFGIILVYCWLVGLFHWKPGALHQSSKI